MARVDALMLAYSGAVPGAALLALVDDGRLSLDDAVRRWLPSLPAAADAITLRQLLTHTSGLIDYEDLIPAATTQQVHDADVLRLLESQNRTYFVPGTSYRYDDLAKWDASLYDSRVLSASSLRMAFTPATPTDDPAVRYGFGWRITGETVGFRNVIIRYPRRHFTVIVLTNRDAPEPYALALAIAKLYLADADAQRMRSAPTA